MLTRRCFAFLLFVILSIPSGMIAAYEIEAAAGVTPHSEWKSGEPIPVGTVNREGPLAPGVTFWTLGFIADAAGGLPSMVMGTDKFSHPSGVYYYKAIGRDPKTNSPIFADPQRTNAPFNGSHCAAVVQDSSGKAYGAWYSPGKIQIAPFDPSTCKFAKATMSLDVSELPRGPSCFYLLPLDDGTMESGQWMVILGVGDGIPHRPEGPSWREPEYRPYDGSGIYRGHLSEFTLYGKTFDLSNGKSEYLGKVSPGDRASLISCDSVAALQLRKEHGGDLLVGTRLGALNYFPAEWKDGIPTYPKRLRAVDHDGNAIRFPSVMAYIKSYPNESTGLDDLVIGTQGFTMYYRFSGQFTDRGEPIFDEPSVVNVKNATLQLGALTVPNIVDWDQDGTLDIVAGNSDGFVMFSRNAGTNEVPRMLPGERIVGGGQDIHVQPGYYDIQGPGEARWGYSCPTTVDWDGDGDIDIVMSDPTAAHTVFLNQAGPGKPPVLAAGRHLYWEHLDLHGTWRVRPAAAQMGDRMAYVLLDKDNELHLYWRLDDYNVESAGKILQPNGKPISGAYLFAGGRGRLKLLLYDWDKDGRVDIVTGTSRHASVGDPNNGLPQALGRPGSSVLWLRNVGTNEKPVLEWPRVLAFKGKPIFFGQHSCAPSIGDLGPGKDENMVVGTEDGRVYFFQREDIGFLSIPEIAKANLGVVIDRLCGNPDRLPDDKGEWLSLRNISDEDIDINGWWLFQRGTRQILRSSQADVNLAPGESLVLGRSRDIPIEGDASVDILLDNDFIFDNSKGIIGLYSFQGLHDAVRWGEGSEELLKSKVTTHELIHGVVDDLCRYIGPAFQSGEVRDTMPAVK
ncbi:lamin tail domain-containing protein [bacterium]|nr:lamin tail domain-containing protein [bacterium]